MSILKRMRLLVALLLVIAVFSGCDVRSRSGENVSSDPDASNETSDPTPPVTSSSAMAVPPSPPEENEPAYVDWMREEKVHEIRIKMDPADWKKICGNPYTGDYHAADVTIDGILVENVGVRTRGHGSLAMATDIFPNSRKYPFKIKFDKYNKDQSFMGLDELALNNGGDDYSFMRDYMGYEAYRLLGGDASCVTFFNVYLNDELRGFYVGVESIDTSYLERLFDSHKNNLYEGENGASLTTYMPLSYLSQQKGKDESKEDVKQLIKVINDTKLGEKGDIESVLDVDSALRYLAVNAVLDNRDGYAGMFAHNYYLYNNNGKFVMLPWDMNAPRVSPWTDIATPATGVYDYSLMNSRPLAKKLIAVEEYYAVYLDYCKQLTEKLPELQEKILRIYGMIKESVEADPNKFCSDNLFNNQYAEWNSYGSVYFLTNRYTYLQKRLAELEGKPASAEVLDPPPPPPPPSSSSSSVNANEPVEADPSGEQADPDDPQNGETGSPQTTEDPAVISRQTETVPDDPPAV